MKTRIKLSCLITIVALISASPYRSVFADDSCGASGCGRLGSLGCVVEANFCSPPYPSCSKFTYDPCMGTCPEGGPSNWRCSTWFSFSIKTIYYPGTCQGSSCTYGQGQQQPDQAGCVYVNSYGCPG